MRRQQKLTTVAKAAAACFVCAVSASAQSRDPPEYSYGRIPFGVTARDVLQELIGTTVDSDHVGKAQFIGHYQMLPDFFTEGLYPNLLGVKQLNVAITRMYRVSHESWANVVAMELYFLCEQEAFEDPASCRLFLIRKTLKTAGTGSHLTVSRSLERRLPTPLDSSRSATT